MLGKPKASFGSITSFILTLILLTACATTLPPNEERIGALHYKRLEWQEQVRFSTGEEIVVKRGERARKVWERYKEGWLFDEAWIEADLPKVGRVRWEGSLSPLILDVTAADEWYLLGVNVTQKGRRDYVLSQGKRYVAFKLLNKTWQRVPFAQVPETFKPNLLANTSRLIWSEGIPGGGSIVTYDMKHRVDSMPTLGREYRIIDRALGE